MEAACVQRESGDMPMLCKHIRQEDRAGWTSSRDEAKVRDLAKAAGWLIPVESKGRQVVVASVRRVIHQTLHDVKQIRLGRHWMLKWGAKVKLPTSMMWYLTSYRFRNVSFDFAVSSTLVYMYVCMLSILFARESCYTIFQCQYENCYRPCRGYELSAIKPHRGGCSLFFFPPPNHASFFSLSNMFGYWEHFLLNFSECRAPRASCSETSGGFNQSLVSWRAANNVLSSTKEGKILLIWSVMIMGCIENGPKKKLLKQKFVILNHFMTILIYINIYLNCKKPLINVLMSFIWLLWLPVHNLKFLLAHFIITNGTLENCVPRIL